MLHAKPLNAFPDATTRRRTDPKDWLPESAPALALPVLILALALLRPGHTILWLAFAAAAIAATCFFAAASLREHRTDDFDSILDLSVIENR